MKYIYTNISMWEYLRNALHTWLLNIENRGHQSAQMGVFLGIQQIGVQ